MPVELVYQKADLKFLQTENGIVVQQHGRQYFARKWQLTDEVKGIIETAIENDFDCLWVDGHPLNTNAHYICFSRSHEKPWEFLIGGEAKPPNVKCITINKKLRLPLSKLSDDLIWQNFGGKHLFIQPNLDRLKWLIDLLKQIPRETLVNATTKRRLNSHEERVLGFQLEKHLEDFVYEHLLARGFHPIRQPKAFKSNRSIEQASIPDIILEHGNEVYIVELKPNATNIADLYQLKRYATNKEIIAKYREKNLKPVLLAGFFHDEIIEEAKTKEMNFELISYKYHNNKVVFKSIMGDGSFYNLLPT